MLHANVIRRVRALLLGACLLGLLDGPWWDARAQSGPSTTTANVFLLDHRNRRLLPSTHALGISLAITNDASLPRDRSYNASSPDPENFRVEVSDPAHPGQQAYALVESRDARTGALHGRPIRVVLTRPSLDVPFRSQYLRLVGDEVDVRAQGVRDRVLHVALRDRVVIRYRAQSGALTTEYRVGEPGSSKSVRAARSVTLAVRILRVRPGGLPSVGVDDESAIRLGREQVRVANEIWLQCFVSFGDPREADVRIVDPPPPTMIAVADGDGLPARGGGVVRFRVNGKLIPLIRTQRGATPSQTAWSIAQAVRRAGFAARVLENPPAEFGAGSSADVLVRSNDGGWVTITPATRGAPIGSDVRQSVQVGEVDLLDGLTEFNNMNSRSGTLEERALIHALADDDPSTLELFLVNRFASASRQGEAFIRASGGPIQNVVVLDRNGIRQQRLAWTQAHEIGHVLLNQPYHPDNIGSDRPWLLMDADSSHGVVTGPKRLGQDECLRVRQQDASQVTGRLLRPFAW
jgi:hypothetical protein